MTSWTPGHVHTTDCFTTRSREQVPIPIY